MSNFGTPISKKLRFRGDINFPGRVDDIFEDTFDRRKLRNGDIAGEENDNKKEESPSFFDFVKIEMTRGYILEHDEERYSARRQKIYSFMKIPREVEKFMTYGVIQCADSFLYIHTFLPIRYILALWALISRPIANCLGLRRRTQRLLTPAEICDLLKGSIWIFCSILMLSVDTNRVYHIIKTQSIIKLYIFYNMLEVGDRLLSAFGQDTIDALFWTATEPKNKKRDHFGLIPHILFALIYVILHSFLIMFQATTLNVAVNSNNKGLLTIMMSNNFVELKGAVFKKFDKNNLFQLTCSDVRERFHLSVLLFIVVIQTMKEFNWSLEQFYVLLPDCCYVLITEILIDWVKHAFITRFNELPVDVYREYTISLAYDMTQTRQKHAFSDHSDLVARRMGFIPFPLGVVLIKAVYTAVSFDNLAAFILAFLIYITLMVCRILNTIHALGKACDLMQQHQDEKANNSTPNSSTGITPITNNIPGINILPNSTTTIINQQKSTRTNSIISSTTTTINTNTNTLSIGSPLNNSTGNKIDQSTSSPLHSYPLQRAHTVDTVSESNTLNNSTQLRNSTGGGNGGCNNIDDSLQPNHLPDSTFGATALFSNSDVDLDDVCLNEKVLNNNHHQLQNDNDIDDDNNLARSVPDLQQESNKIDNITNDLQSIQPKTTLTRRTHKRSESEPSIQCVLTSDKDLPTTSTPTTITSSTTS